MYLNRKNSEVEFNNLQDDIIDNLFFDNLSVSKSKLFIVSIVINKEDTELKVQINAALEKILKNGTVSRLHRKWDLGLAAQVPE